MKKESKRDAQYRRERLKKVQEIHSDWLTFLETYLYMENFTMAAIQREIGEFIGERHPLSVVHAQRGQAKSTIARGAAVFELIHNPKSRVLIITGETSLAKKISKSIIDSIYAFPELRCLWPDIAAGDRSSVQGFDVHHSLRGTDPNPSIAARSIFSGIQGMRADLIIADDIEMMNNSNTSGKREELLQRFRDLASINKGRILALGTHQTSESIYNSFPDMGFKQRFWSGRVPTVEQRVFYGDALAPSIQALYEDPANRVGCGMDGMQGLPTCPEFIGEDKLLSIEKMQGAPFFQLQHMLNPALNDAGIKPLKTDNIGVISLNRYDQLPVVVNKDHRFVHSEGTQQYTLTRVAADIGTLYERPYVIATIDPALGGLKSGDRTGYCVLGVVFGLIYVLDAGSWVGGYTEENMLQWATTLQKYKPSTVYVESNAGNGALTYSFRPILINHADTLDWSVSLEDVRETEQKEVRGINRLAPVIGRGSLIFTDEALRSMEESLSDLPYDKRMRYRLFYQIANVTRQKNSLLHDDSFDALSTAVNQVKERLQSSMERGEARDLASARAIQNFMGRGNHDQWRVKGIYED